MLVYFHRKAADGLDTACDMQIELSNHSFTSKKFWKGRI